MFRAFPRRRRNPKRRLSRSRNQHRRHPSQNNHKSESLNDDMPTGPAKNTKLATNGGIINESPTQHLHVYDFGHGAADECWNWIERNRVIPKEPLPSTHQDSAPVYMFLAEASAGLRSVACFSGRSRSNIASDSIAGGRFTCHLYEDSYVLDIPQQERVPRLNTGQTKAVVALVAGILAERGWVDLDAPIDDYDEPRLGCAVHRSRILHSSMNLVGGQEVNHINGLNLFWISPTRGSTSPTSSTMLELTTNSTRSLRQ